MPPVGLGAMPMSWEPMLDHRDRAIATVHAALDVGVRLFDTANIYAPSWERVGHGEALLAEALATWTGTAPDVVVSSKAGIDWGPGGAVRNANRDHLRAACEASLTALECERIDLYYLHWPARAPSFARQVENMLALQSDGLVQRVGLSNIDARQLAVALDVGGAVDVGGIIAVQNEYSPRFRAHPDVIQRTNEAGVAFLPWSPFGGADRAHKVGTQYAAFEDVADAHGRSVYQVALAWHLRTSPNVITIPGSTRPESINDCFAALDLDLSDDEFETLSVTTPEGTSQYPSDEPAPPLW
ncbi:aldo/keto reductase [Humibacillus sp. DSM 29435]|uniref:aldo/keto reductase n=1 Tax=Humibacillus sp. DSM 29435 TaxID=1869167 RepID=UPI002112D508|nr:aldo/keto reductase [Humibacillus sp. DSM 29435]